MCIYIYIYIYMYVRRMLLNIQLEGNVFPRGEDSAKQASSCARRILPARYRQISKDYAKYAQKHGRLRTANHRGTAETRKRDTDVAGRTWICAMRENMHMRNAPYAISLPVDSSYANGGLFIRLAVT